jgi:hypothetical protein
LFFNNDRENIHDSTFKIDSHEWEVVQIGHNFVSKYEYFVGITLDIIVGVSGPDDSFENANTIHKKYQVSDDLMNHFSTNETKVLDHFELSRNEMATHEYPVLAFIPTMCYCCT